MKFLLGTKEKMTQVFDETGRVYAATALRVSPLTVTQVKTKDSDGYDAIQVGYGEQSEKRVSKALKGHLKDTAIFRYLREVRLSPSEAGNYKVGDSIPLSTFEEGEKVVVSGQSKGKGFQGVVKRHGFKGGPRTHGQKHSEREGGSIGATGPQRVFKGTRMPGRMGGDRITIKNLKVLKVDEDAGVLYISGAIPGRKGTLVEVKGLEKKAKQEAAK